MNLDARFDAGGLDVPGPTVGRAVEEEVPLLIETVPPHAADQHHVVAHHVGHVDVHQLTVALDLTAARGVGGEGITSEVEPLRALRGFRVELQVLKARRGSHQEPLVRPGIETHRVLMTLELVGLVEKEEVEDGGVLRIFAQGQARQEELDDVVVVADPFFQNQRRTLPFQLEGHPEVVVGLLDRTVELELVALDVESGGAFTALGETLEIDVELGALVEPETERRTVAHPLEIEGMEIATVGKTRIGERQRQDGVGVEVVRRRATVLEVVAAVLLDRKTQVLERIAAEIRHVELHPIDTAHLLRRHEIETQLEQARTVVEVQVFLVLGV